MKKSQNGDRRFRERRTLSIGAQFDGGVK